MSLKERMRTTAPKGSSANRDTGFTEQERVLNSFRVSFSQCAGYGGHRHLDR